jgi:hypothetical protein
MVATRVAAMLPNFASESDARAILEDVQRTGVLEPSEDFRDRPGASFAVPRMKGFPAYLDVSVIEAESADTWTTEERVFWSSYLTYNLNSEERQTDGNNHDLFLVTQPPDAPSLIPWIEGEGNCFWFGLTRFPDREQLLITYYPVCR